MGNLLISEPLGDIIRVNEIMSEQVRTVPLTASADDAWKMMRGDRIHHLVVMNGKKVAGVFSARDAGGVSGDAVRDGHQVRDLMSEHVVTAEKNTPLTIGDLVIHDRRVLLGLIVNPESTVAPLG